MKNAEDKCTYGTHNNQSPRPAVLEPGFYLRVSSPRRDDDHVMAEPIADPSLFSWFGELILGTTNSEPAFWLLAITALESSPSQEEGYANFRVVQDSVVNVDQGIPLEETGGSSVQIKSEEVDTTSRSDAPVEESSTSPSPLETEACVQPPVISRVS